MKYVIRCILIIVLGIFGVGVRLHDRSVVRYAQYLDDISWDRVVQVSSWRGIPDLLWGTQRVGTGVSIDTGSTSLSDLLQDQQDLLGDQAVEVFDAGMSGQMLSGQTLSGQSGSGLIQTGTYVSGSIITGSSSTGSQSSQIGVDDSRVSVVIVSGSTDSTGAINVYSSGVLVQ